MSNLQIFNNQEFGEIRMMVVDGKPYAVGVDVARALEYAKPSQAVIDHCKGIRKLGIPSAGGTQETNIIPEGDILRLIVKAADQSKNWEIKEKACRFESLIFDEILPSINKHGGYLTADKIEEVLMNPDTIIKLAQNLKAERGCFFLCPNCIISWMRFQFHEPNIPSIAEYPLMKTRLSTASE